MTFPVVDVHAVTRIKLQCRRNLLTMFTVYGLLVSASVSAQSATAGQTGALCPVTVDIPPRPLLTEPLKLDDLYLTANQAVSIEGGTSTATGNAELAYNEQQLTADRIDYHQTNDIVDLQGDVNYWDNDVYLNSSSAHIELEADNGAFADVNYWLLDNRGRGKADKVNVSSGTLTVGERVDYTTCDPDTGSPWNLTTNIWKLSASKLTLNHETDRAYGKHVILKVKGIPIFYTPWLSFPTSDKRKSGFLMPGFGSSTRNGAELQVPYYWNIAPDMDATITPRLMSNVGAMLAGQYRYLLSRGSGTLDIEYLQGDSRFDDKSRSSIAFEHRQTFLQSGYLALLYNRVSDQHYLEDFSSSLLGTSIQFLEQSATTSYTWSPGGHYLNLYNVIGNFQTVDRNLPVAARPYRRLPSTTLNYGSPYKNTRLNYNLLGKFDYFTRGNDISLSSVNGMRYDIAPAISLPMNRQSYFVIPKAGARFTQYHLDGNNNFSDERPDRLLPFFSLDSGIFLERNTRILGEQVLQTLEPRFYYLYVPEEDQTDLPIFDTGPNLPTFASLFYENRFNGFDRIGDANQFTLAATSSLYSESTGQHLGYFSLGQTYYLRDLTVTMPGAPVQTGNQSAIFSELGTTLFDNLELRAEFQWDPILDATQKLGFHAMYRPGPGKVLNLGYSDYKLDPYATVIDSTNIGNFVRGKQTDISFHWPIKPELNVVGKWNYALEEARTLDVFAGLEYNSCCWGVRIVGRRFLSNIEGEFESGVFLQFELKGLAGIGEKTVDFLNRSIPGYESEF